jgi:hypothetical protein
LGRPVPPATLHAPSEADLANIAEAGAGWGGRALPVLPRSRRAGRGGRGGGGRGGGGRGGGGRGGGVEEEPIIGFVSSGGYSKVLGRGLAICYCAAEPLLHLVRGPANLGGEPVGPLLLLLRNTSSRQFRPALVTIETA